MATETAISDHTSATDEVSSCGFCYLLNCCDTSDSTDEYDPYFIGFLSLICMSSFSKPTCAIHQKTITCAFAFISITTRCE